MAGLRLGEELLTKEMQDIVLEGISGIEGKDILQERRTKTRIHNIFCEKMNLEIRNTLTRERSIPGWAKMSDIIYIYSESRHIYMHLNGEERFLD